MPASSSGFWATPPRAMCVAMSFKCMLPVAP